MERRAEPSVSVGDVGERAEPIEAKEFGVVGEEGGAGGVARGGVGDGAGESVRKSRG